MTTIGPMEHNYGYESCLPYASSSSSTTELEKQRERWEIPVGSPDDFQPRENAAVHSAAVGLLWRDQKNPSSMYR